MREEAKQLRDAIAKELKIEALVQKLYRWGRRTELIAQLSAVTGVPQRELRRASKKDSIEDLEFLLLLSQRGFHDLQLDTVVEEVHRRQDEFGRAFEQAMRIGLTEEELRAMEKQARVEFQDPQDLGPYQERLKRFTEEAAELYERPRQDPRLPGSHPDELR